MDDLKEKVATAALEAATAAIADQLGDEYLVELIVDVPDARHVRVSSTTFKLSTPRYFQVEVEETRADGQTYALFVRIDGKWRFEGIVESNAAVNEFAERVLEDIDGSAATTVQTEAYKVVPLT